MPTSRRRHTITETEPVQAALDELRRAGVRPDLPQLVILGAKVALEEAAVDLLGSRDELRRQLIADARSGNHGVDLDAAAAGRRPAWDR